MTDEDMLKRDGKTQSLEMKVRFLRGAEKKILSMKTVRNG